LRKRLDMHQEVREAAMDTMVEQQGDYLENSVLESLRKAEVAVNKFLESNPSLMKRLDNDKHQKVREAAMDKVVEQEDLMENSMFKCLSEADIIAGNFLRSEHIPYLRGRQMSKELQSLGVNEIPELQVGDIRRAECDTYDIVSKTGVVKVDRPVDIEEFIKEPSNLEFASLESATQDRSLFVVTRSVLEMSVGLVPVHKASGVKTTAIEASLGDHHADIAADDTGDIYPLKDHLPWLALPGSKIQASEGRFNVLIKPDPPTNLTISSYYQAHNVRSPQVRHRSPQVRHRSQPASSRRPPVRQEICYYSQKSEAFPNNIQHCIPAPEHHPSSYPTHPGAPTEPPYSDHPSLSLTLSSDLCLQLPGQAKQCPQVTRGLNLKCPWLL
jgi:hypothetical protein